MLRDRSVDEAVINEAAHLALKGSSSALAVFLKGRGLGGQKPLHMDGSAGEQFGDYGRLFAEMKDAGCFD